MFIEIYSCECSLLQCSKFSRVPCENWGSLFKIVINMYYQRNLKNRKLSGHIEIDHSLFGKKYNRENGSKRLRIWVFGLVENESSTIQPYPLTDRKESTHLPLIQRHVKKGRKSTSIAGAPNIIY